MNLNDILNKELIDIADLKKGLKHIGLELSRFEDIGQEQLPSVIELFRIAVNIDPKTSTKLTKMDVRLKLEKVLKGGALVTQIDLSKVTTKPKENIAKTFGDIKNPQLNSIATKEHHTPTKHIKLGKVKFFDATKGFGYIHSFEDEKECFIHVSNLLTPGITTDEIVILETQPSRKKTGELDAINVSNKVPVVIFNKKGAVQPICLPLIENSFPKKIAIRGKYENCFATVTGQHRRSYWEPSVVQDHAIQKEVKVQFGKTLLVKHLLNPVDYIESIVWLTNVLKPELEEAEIHSLYADGIESIERESLTEVTSRINAAKEIPLFQPYLKPRAKLLSKVSFALWTLGEIETLPTCTKQEDFDLWNLDILPALDWKELQQVITKISSEQGPTRLVEESYNYLISRGWEINTEEELETVIIFLKTFIGTFASPDLTEANFKCSDNDYYIELYEQGLLQELSDIRVRTHIEKIQNDNDKAHFIEKQPADKIIKYYLEFPSLSNYRERHITSILENKFAKIDFLCFDLESDGEKINEFAWKSESGVRSDVDYKIPGDGIAELVSLLNSSRLIIGQNIKKFDLLILADHGASPPADLIWDTLEVEMFLNPERFSYGLKTEHGAVSDVELTYRLFKNQLSRIIASINNSVAIKELLPSKAINAINQISTNPTLALLDYNYLTTQANEFFRPNPTNRNLPEQILAQLSKNLEDVSSKIIIAPEFLWDTLSHQFDFAFYSTDKFLSFHLNKEKIAATFADENILKAILYSFVDSRVSKGLQSYLQHLPTAIKSMLTNEQSTAICDCIEVDFGNKIDKPICIKPTDIEILKQYVNHDSDIQTIVIGSELYNLTSKLQLGQDLDFATIFARLKNEPIWLQMSGGKSFVSLEQIHCSKLGITEFPKFLQNIWLEKIGNGKFRVWCNVNFKASLEDLPLNKVYHIDWVEETFTKTNSFVIRPDAKNSSYIAEEKRVNPESLYRKSYWTYQFKLFEGMGEVNNPKVLIINNESEIEKLSAYARRKGYYIPDKKASLARQVELLHTHRSSNKLLIASFLILDKVISTNYSGSIDFIWDSFLLQEKLQMLKNTIEKTDIELSENAKYIPTIKKDLVGEGDFDTYKLFRLHKPLVDYYYKMIVDNNPDSCLYLCDTRLADFVGIEQSLDVKSKYARLWNRIEEYQSDYKEASEFFPSDITVDIDFDVREAKEILRRLFLPQNENGDFFDWYDYQDQCLNDILPAKKDLLISLPTGAGKSVLFQAPALFRSSFTNKLSIVVSPLRALMHDQVETLWDKGLYSNVEYLSGDKSHEEIKDIYRRIVGGEITLLYITPERFRSRSFENCLLTRLDADSGLEYVVFDEAHCISQWGQEFRPDYLNAGRKVAGYSGIYKMSKLLFSATISEQVFEEISVLMPGVVTVEGTEKSYNPVRDHIKMDFKHNVVEDDMLLEVANYLKSGKFNFSLSRAIIFVKSRKKVEECSLIMPDSLRDVFGADCSFADKVGGFHAGMDAEDRTDTYERFKAGEILILFATKAFGMGMDIPNVHFVTHYSPPSTFEDFLQEVGRAGRNEKQRLEAGFSNIENPIRTLCLTTTNDFAKLKDQLHESRISWHEVKDIKHVLQEYIERFKPLTSNTEIPVAVPFNLYSNKKGSVNDDLDNKFRIALHWLERLERIKLGYFTITHLEFDSASLNKLAERINNCPDKDCEKVCYAIIELQPIDYQSSKVVQLSIASLRSISRLSLNNLFSALLKNHSAGIFKLIQDVVIEPSKIRFDETNHCKNIHSRAEKYPALQVIFSLASKILSTVPINDSKIFDGEELDVFIHESITENIKFKKLPWTKKDNAENQTKEYNNYLKDIVKKRSKHAFTIIRLLGKTKHETKMEKVTDGNQKVKIKQSIFNGYHKKEEWSNKIAQIKKDCIKLLDYVSQQYFEKNLKNFNWPDIISGLNFEGNIQYLSDLLFILSVSGYSKTGGLLPSGIEIYLTSTENIDETDLQSADKIIYEEFDETRKVRELKLIVLEVLAGFHKGELGNNVREIRKKQDTFIRKYFGCNSLESLLQVLQEELPPNDPLLVKWRGDAMKTEEDRLNKEQRNVYDAEINQHINVMAGPGSGKTHTLTLRVAKLVHHIGTNPEEILVLAYNRAVVSELKERLGHLFNDLGYGNLAKRIKIFTFHGLAKRYCQNEVNGHPFDTWENILLQRLISAPGQIMNQLAPLKHILVDEFQDINNVRIKLLNKLHELTDSQLFIIGDPNQSIYGYERIKEGGSMGPWPYYADFNKIFNPTQFKLYDNHRSYPAILNLASQILTLPAEHEHLIPRPTRVPDENFIANYAQIIDRTQQRMDWWDQISMLMQERVGQRPYKQIAILFRTNNEVYRGFQKIKGLNLPNIRIRIQGSLPYEFTRIRECHAVMLFLKSKIGEQILPSFKQTFREFIGDLINHNQNWTHFYIRVIHALVLEYLEEQDEHQVFDGLLEFINELTQKDDGQLYKIYEKHVDKITNSTSETEIVLTTMHKVKGLEFDSVIIPPSFSNLPLNSNELHTQAELEEQLDEEKRLAFVAYTRARYRLVIFKHFREIALANGNRYVIPENENVRMGIPLQPGIKKLKIGWAAKAFNFNSGVNSYINASVRSGDFVFIRRKVISHNGAHFSVHELLKENSTRPIGELAGNANIAGDHQTVTGFVVSEVVVWSYEDTCRFDLENETNFARDWCTEARDQGYIYLVDFAGFGVPGS
ncbi:DEAD/DEAH box helicase [Dyadobacter sp. CY351]|uniref:DEAD/DEAH box helicase n=1 Tax=Dyadobacter sp. CY351 TaxID=2909337 RepID=UPI001F3AD0A2|nr:DEAD/DEAH box helicase [Dyadobacter sp. CY351]MCF2518523.1 UvrD-helicase domain-containing protein [Dyadobacter sp. CY351]